MKASNSMAQLAKHPVTVGSVAAAAVAALTSSLLVISSGALSHQKSDMELLTSYRRDGFVIVRSLLSLDEVSLVRQAIEQSDALNAAANTIMLNDDDGGATRLNLWSNPGNGTLGMLSRSRRVVGTMRALLGGDILHYHSKTLIKQPREGGQWNWHQDYGYWYKDHFLLPHMATAYFAIDPQTAENGALTVLNGSHVLGRIDHWTRGDQQGADLERVEQSTARFKTLTLNLQPGDAVFFDALLLHQSPGNLSPRRRMAFASAYTREDNVQFRHNDAHIPCWELEEVPDSLMLERGLKFDRADTMLMMDGQRGKAAAAKREGSGYD